MNRILALFVTFLSLSVSAEDCQSLVISAHPNYPPYHWRDGDKIVGASIEITGQILDEMGIVWSTSYEGPWKRVLKNAENGKIDLVSGLKIVPERSQYLSYTSAPFSANPIAVFSLASTELGEINQISDLKDYYGSISLGDKHGSEIDSFVTTNPKIQQVRGLEQNFTMLEMGRTDYFIIGYYSGMSWLHKQGLQSRFAVKLIFEDTLIHHGFSKKSPCKALEPAFSAKLQEYYESGKTESTLKKYEQIWLEQTAKK